MPSLVLEVQRAALDASVSVGSLLLMAKVIATKLGLKDDLIWISDELQGYEDYGRMPEYRRVAARIQALNPYHGWQPVNFGNPEIEEMFCRQPMFDSISVLAELSSRAIAENGSISKKLPQSGLDLIYSYMPVRLQVLAFIDASALTHIVEAVRARILGWPLSLV